MTDKLAVTLTVEPDEQTGKFWYSLDGGASRVGAYDNEDLAVEAALSFLGESIAQATKVAIIGD